MRESFILILLILIVIATSFLLASLKDFSVWFSDAAERLGIGQTYSEAPVSLTCEKEEIYVKEKNNCTVTGCKKGWWEITNLENNPLNETPILEKINLTSNFVEFGPALEKGEILIRVLCDDPKFETNDTVMVIGGPYIDCPESCQLKEDCTCTVNNCLDGLFLLKNYKNNPLMNNIIEEISGTFNFSFRASREGVVEARIRCKEPYFKHNKTHIVIGKPLERFYMSSISCNETSCSLTIDKNVMEQGVNVIVQLIKEPYGIIYSTGSVDIEQGFTGEKEITLTNIKKCSEGTELKVLAIASVSGQRIDRLKDSYVC